MSGNPSMLPDETSADYCRRMGWGIGTRIVGDEGYGPTIITITAVGQEDILAKADGRDEKTWTLEYRDWQLVEPAPADHAAAIAEAAREYVAAIRSHEGAWTSLKTKLAVWDAKEALVAAVDAEREAQSDTPPNTQP